MFSDHTMGQCVRLVCNGVWYGFLCKLRIIEWRCVFATYQFVR